MAHNSDVEGDTSELTSTYECLRCGNRKTEQTHPGRCECSGEYQNLAKSLE